MGIEVHLKTSAFDNAKGFNVFEQNDKIGSFDMGIYQPLGQALLYLTTHPNPGRGKSGLVVGAFRDQIGHGTDFVAPDIIHEDTWKALARLRLIEQANAQNHLSIVQHKILSSIPIIHILQAGGVKVIRLDMKKRDNSTLEQIYYGIIQSADSGPRYFDTVIYARA